MYQFVRKNLFVRVLLKGGCRNLIYSVIGPVVHNIWWGNSRNRLFEPKNRPSANLGLVVVGEGEGEVP